MRKKIITVFAVCLLALCLTVVFVACDDNTGGGGGDDKGTFYSIQAPAASDVYTVSGLPEGAYEGDTVTFTVALTNPADSSILGVTVGTRVRQFFRFDRDVGRILFVHYAR